MIEDITMWDDFTIDGFFDFVHKNKSNINSYSKFKQQNQKHHIKQHLEALFGSLEKIQGADNEQ